MTGYEYNPPGQPGAWQPIEPGTDPTLVLPGAPSERLLDMQGIVKSFNVGTESQITILPGVNFHVNRGEFVSVVGASGSGKSTLMNIIGLLDRANQGNYTFDGEDIMQLDDDDLAFYRSQNIGFIFQSFNLIGRISALKNVEMPMMYAGINVKERRERAEHLLEQMGMADRMMHNPVQLSGGQKQRVAIARALANDPPLLLADEPTGALDSQTGRMVMDLFHQLNGEQNKTIVFITHNSELAAETTRVVTMVDGRIVSGEDAATPYLGAPAAGPVATSPTSVLAPPAATPQGGGQA
ncbi:ABC transporter ATP-binding protein [Rothia endophytica]|uniref:ABC transporter ATP-binding protein n=1 Tax=Rothia endophytica TaxID=1324766 RepID=UPI001F21F100|nr:ABC transporter ATP-binding protein [Rothia endophytica]